MTLLNVENLAIDVTRDKQDSRLVHDADFSVSAGETLAIVGESGSGKSLTSLAVMGLLAKDLSIGSGRILFEGKDLATLSEKDRNDIRGRDMAMIFQEPMTSLNPVRSIGAQLTEGMRLKLGLSRPDAQARALSLLEQVGISDPKRRLKQFPHQLSGGMRQRVMIAIALACRPKLILADEPTTALDVTIQAQILSLISKLCERNGVGLVLVTHNLGIVARHAQTVAVMYAGRIVEQAPARALYRNPQHPYTRGLLDSVPRLDQPRNVPLRPISGAPPDPLKPVPGCRFHPRCAYAAAACQQTVPEMTTDGAHGVACHFPLRPRPDFAAA